MKLKKLLALAMSGVLAVSMFAGCSTASNNGNGGEGEGEGEGSPATGYSVDLGNALADALKEAKIDTVVTFADSNDDKAALEDALGNLDRTQLFQTSGKGELYDLKDEDVVADFEDAAKLDRATLTNPTDIFDYKYNLNKTVKVGDIFAVDATIDMSKAINYIVDKYESAFKGLKKSITIQNDQSAKLVYDYNYTVSVSVVNVPAPDVTIYTGSTNFIAVTVTRTVA